MTPRHFEASALVEYADGSASLMVQTRGKRCKTLEIHMAAHVYQDIRFTIYRQYPDERVKAARLKEAEHEKRRRA